MNKRKLIIGGVVLLAALLVFLFGFDSKSFEYSPTSVTNKSGPIVIKAKLDIVNSGAFTISPSVKGDVQVVDNFLIFWPAEGEGYEEDRRYTAKFRNYKQSSGEILDIPNITFRIDRNATYSKLQNEVLSKYGRFEVSLNPFLEKLPKTEAFRYKISYEINDLHETEGKSIVEILGNETNWREKKLNYTVVIETLIIQGRTESSDVYVQEIQKARQEALAWISQQGVDVNKDILYVFVPDDNQINNPPAQDADLDI